MNISNLLFIINYIRYNYIKDYKKRRACHEKENSHCLNDDSIDSHCRHRLCSLCGKRAKHEISRSGLPLGTENERIQSRLLQQPGRSCLLRLCSLQSMPSIGPKLISYRYGMTFSFLLSDNTTRKNRLAPVKRQACFFCYPSPI